MNNILLYVALFVIAFVDQASAVTWYVRTDGGTDTQCTGLTDAAYPGSGTGVDCAVSHPYYALRVNGSYVSGRFVAGDTMIISPGSYPMGAGHATTGAGSGSQCSPAYSYDCKWALPGGTDTDHPTQVLGKGWDTPGSEKPELWGRGRIYDGVINSYDQSNIVIKNLEITDHEASMEGPNNHPNPIVDGARNGLFLKHAGNVVLSDLNIHGLAVRGIWYPGAHDWTMSNIAIRGNGFSGVDADTSDSDTLDQTYGTFTVNNMTVDYSGCVEDYPDTTAIKPGSCVGQGGLSQYYQGYGDAFGWGNGSMGSWTINNLKCRYNTQDCFDGLHGSGDLPVKITNSLFEGNSGAAIKIAGQLTLENSVVIGNCGWHSGTDLVYDDGVNGLAVPFCRADSIIDLGMSDSKIHKLYGNTIYGENMIVISAHGTSCIDGKVELRNSIVQGGRVFYEDTTNPFPVLMNGHTPTSNAIADAYYVYGGCTAPLDEDYNIFNNTKDGTNDVDGAHSKYASPAFSGAVKTGPYSTVGYMNTVEDVSELFLLGSSSPARFEVTGGDSADETLTFYGTGSEDYNSFSRGANWDTGALEFGSSFAGQQPPSTGSASVAATGSASITAGGSGAIQ